jgi:hypothetical protein
MDSSIAQPRGRRMVGSVWNSDVSAVFTRKHR